MNDSLVRTEGKRADWDCRLTRHLIWLSELNVGVSEREPAIASAVISPAARHVTSAGPPGRPPW